MIIIIQIIVNCTTILWAVPVYTDQTMLANGTDKLLQDKQEKTLM